METFSSIYSILSTMCKLKGKWGIFIQFNRDSKSDKEICEVLPKELTHKDSFGLNDFLIHERGFFFFETEKECRNIFEQLPNQQFYNLPDNHIEVWAFMYDSNGNFIQVN